MALVSDQELEALDKFLALLAKHNVMRYAGPEGDFTIAVTPRRDAISPLPLAGAPFDAVPPYDENDAIDDSLTPEQRAKARADRLLFRSSK